MTPPLPFRREGGREPSGRKRVAGAALLLAGALFSSLPGCASAPRGVPPPGTPARIDGVPFFRQDEGNCGPSALAMVLTHLGRPTDPAELSRESSTEPLRGVLITDLAATARRRGFDAEVEELPTDGVASLVAGGTPVLLLVDDGFLAYSVPHYVVAVGLLRDGLLVHSGKKEGRVISWGALEGKRRKMGNLALVVRRKGGTP